MTNLIISPHTDDAIFSIGEYLSKLPDVVIASPLAGIPNDKAGKAKHTLLRKEHSSACVKLGALEINGQFLDDVYPEPDQEKFDQWFVNLYRDVPPVAVYIPLGIHHPDHVLTTASALYNLPDGVELYFYEELPYRILYPELRDRQLESARSFSDTELITTTPTSNKKGAVEMYNSQIQGEVINYLYEEERIWKIT